MKPRAVLFIDGNNFHHRMVALGRSAYRLNYAAFSQHLTAAADQHWQETRYYVGKVEVAKDGNVFPYNKQQRFFATLTKQHASINIHLGRLEPRPVKGVESNLRRWLKNLPHREDFTLPEKAVAELNKIAFTSGAGYYVEKAVDVMIATDMVAMAHNDEFDVAHLLTADGDFSPAIKKVQEAGKEVRVSSSKRSRPLMQVADKFTMLTAEDFTGCWL